MVEVESRLSLCSRGQLLAPGTCGRACCFLAKTSSPRRRICQPAAGVRAGVPTEGRPRASSLAAKLLLQSTKQSVFDKSVKGLRVPIKYNFRNKGVRFVTSCVRQQTYGRAGILLAGWDAPNYLCKYWCLSCPPTRRGSPVPAPPQETLTESE